MQSRHTLPGWYGLGSAVTEYLSDKPDGLAMLRDMYARWPFWRTLIDNAQMILAKADLTIARLYADLVEDQALAARIYGRIAAEYRDTADAVCQITGQSALLERSPMLRHVDRAAQPVRRSAELHPTGAARSGCAPATGTREELVTAVLESINGVASGLKNTG